MQSATVQATDIITAAERLAGHIRRTPVEEAPELGLRTGTSVVLKLENTQLTGSFKIRGATNVIRSLPSDARKHGVVAASTGNHGAGVSYAAKRAGVPAKVFVPEHLPDEKLCGIRRHGAEVVRVGIDCIQAELAAREYASRHPSVFISPYNDPAVIAGQGTVAVEMLEQIPDLDVALVAVGGGGLISGIGIYLKAVNPSLQVVAVSPENSCVMHLSLSAGHPVDQVAQDTLSDSTAGGIEKDSITHSICREVVDRSVTVSEAQIAQALRYIIGQHHTLVEGAAAAAVAGLDQISNDYRGARIGIVLCGANIPNSTLQRVLSQNFQA